MVIDEEDTFVGTCKKCKADLPEKPTHEEEVYVDQDPSGHIFQMSSPPLWKCPECGTYHHVEEVYAVSH